MGALTRGPTCARPPRCSATWPLTFNFNQRPRRPELLPVHPRPGPRRARRDLGRPSPGAPDGPALPRERLLRDYRIYMSHRGRVHAESLEAKYANVITRESYRAECARQEAELADPKARAAALKRYRQRVEDGELKLV